MSINQQPPSNAEGFFRRADVDRVGKVTVETRFGLARLKRCTQETLLAEGALPFPLLQTVIRLRQAPTDDAPGLVNDEQLRTTLDIMRKIVCAASDKPRIVELEDPSDPEAVPVTDFNLTDLKLLYDAATSAPRLGGAAAVTTFPRAESAHADAVGQSRETVRPEAEQLGAGAIELEHR
jgi:hypothetical protein